MTSDLFSSPPISSQIFSQLKYKKLEIDKYRKNSCNDIWLLFEMAAMQFPCNGILEFDRSFYLQLIGIAMGASWAPVNANLFMAVVDIWFESCGIDGCGYKPLKAVALSDPPGLKGENTHKMKKEDGKQN